MNGIKSIYTRAQTYLSACMSTYDD